MRDFGRAVGYLQALGSHPPPPLQLPLHDSTGSLWQRNKQNGVDFLAAQGKDIEQAKRIVVIGGGALGIQCPFSDSVSARCCWI